MYTAEQEEQLLSGSPSFVLDAIDNIDTKVGVQLLMVVNGVSKVRGIRWIYLQHRHKGGWPVKLLLGLDQGVGCSCLMDAQSHACGSC